MDKTSVRSYRRTIICQVAIQNNIMVDNITDIFGKIEYINMNDLDKCQCKMCTDGPVGVKWTRDIMLGVKSLEQCATHYGMTIFEVQEHVYTHEILREDADDIDDQFYLDKLLRMLAYMENWASDLMSDGESDKASIDSLTKLVKEMRTTITTIAEFKGRLDRTTTKINVEKIEGKVLSLVNVILEDVCDDCRSKITKVMSKQ